MFKGKQLAEIELPKEVIVSRHEEELPPPDPERDVIVAAAVQLEHHRREREDLKQQVIAARDELKERLMAAELVLQAKDVKIEECELALATGTPPRRDFSRRTRPGHRGALQGRSRPKGDGAIVQQPVRHA